MRKNIKLREHKLLLAIMTFFLCLIIFLEISERKNSFLKSWLYENNTNKELVVATTAMSPDKEPSINRGKMVEFINRIKKAQPNVDLIVFGEVILGWYRSESDDYHKNIAEPVPGATTLLMSKLARENNVFISFGLVEKALKKIYNSQVLINNNGEIINVRRKKNLPSGFFSPGQESISIVDIKGITTGVVICYDINNDETLDKAKINKVDLLIISNADYTDEWDNKHFAYKYLAKKFNTWIITSNRFGTENETHWDGHLEILNPFGDLLASGVSKEQFIVYNIKINKGQSEIKDHIRKIYSKISLGYLVLKNLRIALSYL